MKINSLFMLMMAHSMQRSSVLRIPMDAVRVFLLSLTKNVAPNGSRCLFCCERAKFVFSSECFTFFPSCFRDAPIFERKLRPTHWRPTKAPLCEHQSATLWRHRGAIAFMPHSHTNVRVPAFAIRCDSGSAQICCHRRRGGENDGTRLVYF